ncbi:unnamed protein product [Prorocentrum cordatum]|uniref:Uncharacterized protein n=1 Tax=Prorocentrum cordatum TaxID=2364126 RepID=A0ABN9TBL6_9DINO|nr:unnamed protein product [Polarella glacialis]
MRLTIEDLKVIIMHHLRTGFFLLGGLGGMEVEGLAMGSPMGRRISEANSMGYIAWILEIRYTDDYILLWKGSPQLRANDITMLSACLARRALERYPLPRGRDDSLKFVSTDIHLNLDGSVEIRPAVGHLGGAGRDFEFEGFVPYYSFVPRGIERAVVLGIVARVAQFTSPPTLRLDALSGSGQHLIEVSGYPEQLFKTWVSEGMCHWST